MGDGVCLKVAASHAGRTINLSGHLVHGGGQGQLGDGSQNDNVKLHCQGCKCENL